MFQEFYQEGHLSQIVDEAEWYEMSGDGEYHIDAVQDDRCGKCGSQHSAGRSKRFWQKGKTSWNVDQVSPDLS